MTVAVGVQDRRFAIDDLRALLVGDVLARTCEDQGTQVLVELALPDDSGEQVRALLKAADQLGIHPPARVYAHREVDGADRSTADLVVVSRPHFGSAFTAPLLLVTGPVAGGPSSGGPALPADLSTLVPGPERGPLALRLTFLEHAVTDPVRLIAGSLTEAATRLSRWRAFVADLARAPSGPLDADMVQASFDGLSEDLDARVAVRVLHALEDRSDMSDGTRFETCVRLDQVLGLELARDIGLGPR